MLFIVSQMFWMTDQLYGGCDFRCKSISFYGLAIQSDDCYSEYYVVSMGDRNAVGLSLRTNEVDWQRYQ